MAEEIENIFEGVEFGDSFVTRDGRVAIYWNEICYPDEYMCRAFILPNGDYIETDLYDGIHLINGNKMSDNSDIVSRYQEEIDEEKLDKLAEKLYQEEAERNLWQADKESFFCGVKVGYRQRAKEER